jgi:hypothetical protein
VTQMALKCNFVHGAYVNGKPSSTLLAFSPDVNPGYKIEVHPANIVYLEVIGREIRDATVWLADENGKDVDLRDETLAVALHLRPVS